MNSPTYKHFAECAGETVELQRIAYSDLARDFSRVIGRAYAGETLVRDCQLFAWGICPRCAGHHATTRRILFSKSSTPHRCNSLCLDAKGKNCECACGGKNHGAGFQLQMEQPVLF